LTLDVGSSIDYSVLRRAFEEGHQARYGHVMDGAVPVQVLAVRLTGLGRSTSITLPRVSTAEDAPAARALMSRRAAWCFASSAEVEFSVYDRSQLAAADRVVGPAIVDEGTSTTVVQSDQVVEVDEYGHLLISSLGGGGR
jgi:N-methylhydantoinase A